MADKGSRRAARQAALSKKKRRGSRTPTIAPELALPTPSVSDEDEDIPDTGLAPNTELALEANATSSTSSLRRRAVGNRSGTRLRDDETQVSYPFLGNELQNIAFLLVLMAIILVALTFILR